MLRTSQRMWCSDTRLKHNLAGDTFGHLALRLRGKKEGRRL